MDIREAAAMKWPDLKIEECIGQGSGGRVYRASMVLEGGEEVYALKHVMVPANDLETGSMYREGMSADQVEDYYERRVGECLQEIRIMHALEEKDHVAAIADDFVCREPDRIKWHILILMEYLTPLPDFLDGREADEGFVRELGMDICLALSECEKKGILHRDIKPENIFVTKEGRFKLGDFGISRLVPRDPAVLSLRGTPAYLAPEVYLGEPSSPRADQYSLGIVLYTLLNRGRLPLMDQDKVLLTTDETEAAILRRLGGEVLPPPVRAPGRLGEVILKACRPDPGERFESAEAFRKALEDPGLFAEGGRRRIKTGPLKRAVLLMFSAAAAAIIGLSVFTAAGPGAQSKDIGGEIEDTIAWTSRALEIEACAACQLPPGSPLTRQDAAGIEAMYFKGEELGDISDLKWMTGLRMLYLENCSADDLTVIASLKNLEILSLSGTEAEDLSFLTKCPSLKSLDLSGTGISDYSFLPLMTGLTGLSLAGSVFEDGKLPALPPSLEYLDLSGTEAEDLSSLSGMYSLKEIYTDDMPGRIRAQIKNTVPAGCIVRQQAGTAGHRLIEGSHVLEAENISAVFHREFLDHMDVIKLVVNTDDPDIRTAVFTETDGIRTGKTGVIYVAAGLH
jgi:hypothetical protein